MGLRLDQAGSAVQLELKGERGDQSPFSGIKTHTMIGISQGLHVCVCVCVCVPTHVCLLTALSEVASSVPLLPCMILK